MIYWDFPYVFDNIINHTLFLKVIGTPHNTAIDQQGKSSNELIIDEKLQNAGISKRRKSYVGNQAARKGLQRSLL